MDCVEDAVSEPLTTGVLPILRRSRVICALLRHAERAEKKEMIDALHSWLVTEMLELILGYCSELIRQTSDSRRNVPRKGIPVKTVGHEVVPWMQEICVEMWKTCRVAYDGAYRCSIDFTISRVRVKLS